MSPTTSNASAIALLEAQLMSGAIDRPAFLRAASRAGLSASESGLAADKALAITRNQSERRSRLQPSYDYIVVGSGASGSVVAGRLAEDPSVQVLLLEAGGEDLSPEVLNTENWFVNIGTERDWSFRAVPGASVNYRALHQAAGKILGGGTSINGMVWARGHQHDFDGWAKAASDEAWSYAHVLEVYKRIEDWNGPADAQRRGTGGKVFVQPAPDPSPLATAFLAGAASLGIPTFDDQNGVMQEGSGGAAITNVRIRDGRRRNVPAEYLYPVMDQPNLTVLTRAHVNRVTMDGRTATGIEFEWQGETRSIRASSEVVLSAGAIHTPKILLLSGIGDRAQLVEHGIHVAQHLPGVGRNLQDHPIIGAGLWEPHEAIAGRNNSAEANAFVKSRPELHTPDLHIWAIQAPYLSEVTARFAVPGAWSISPGLVRPESRGFLRLRSADPREAIEIHANMLDDPRDLAAMRKAMELARQIGNSQALSPYVKREILPGPLKGEALDNLIRDAATSMHHPTSTAKMGTDDMSVVDSRLRVHEIRNLRVADGSVMPTITTGNTHAPCVLIGERLVEIIRG
jgi:choline dehydrogenase